MSPVRVRPPLLAGPETSCENGSQLASGLPLFSSSRWLSGPAGLASFVGALDCFQIDLLHLEHGLHGSAGLHGIGFREMDQLAAEELVYVCLQRALALYQVASYIGRS